MKNQTIVLIGMRGSGKTTIGQVLSKLTGLDLFDTDLFISSKYGPIDRIFVNQGETFFRREEALALEQSIAHAPCIVATGGGAPMHPGFVDTVSGCFIVELFVDQQTALERIRNSDRPPLTLLSPDQEYRSLYEQRKATYASISHARFETGQGSSPRSVAELIRTAATSMASG